jgi:hypothetical protein
MSDKTAKTSGLRLILTLQRGGDTAKADYYDITDIVVELGPLCSGGGGVSGEPQAESIRLRLFGDDRYNPRKPGSVFGDYEHAYLDTYKDGRHIFFGAISGPPRLDESAERETTTLHFVGGLKELWPQQVDDFTEGDIEYADPEYDLWPLLLDAATLPISRSSFALAPIVTDEDVWSAAGRPHIELPGYEEDDIAEWDIVSPVDCASRSLVYVGFGPFILSYHTDNGKWEVVAEVDAEWLISHLEYDTGSDRISGVAAMNEDDITLRAAHTRARFSINL